MTRLSPAERARQAKASGAKTKAKPSRARSAKSAPVKRVKKLSARVGSAQSLSAQGSQQLRVLFDQIFRAQSVEFYRLLGVTLFLVAFGVVMVLSASSIDSLVANSNSLWVFLKQFGLNLQEIVCQYIIMQAY